MLLCTGVFGSTWKVSVVVSLALAKTNPDDRAGKPVMDPDEPAPIYDKESWTKEYVKVPLSEAELGKSVLETDWDDESDPEHVDDDVKPSSLAAVQAHKALEPMDIPSGLVVNDPAPNGSAVDSQAPGGGGEASFIMMMDGPHQANFGIGGVITFIDLSVGRATCSLSPRTTECVDLHCASGKHEKYVTILTASNNCHDLPRRDHNNYNYELYIAKFKDNKCDHVELRVFRAMSTEIHSLMSIDPKCLKCTPVLHLGMPGQILLPGQSFPVGLKALSKDGLKAVEHCRDLDAHQTYKIVKIFVDSQVVSLRDPGAEKGSKLLQVPGECLMFADAGLTNDGKYKQSVAGPVTKLDIPTAVRVGKPTPSVTYSDSKSEGLVSGKPPGATVAEGTNAKGEKKSSGQQTHARAGSMRITFNEKDGDFVDQDGEIVKII